MTRGPVDDRGIPYNDEDEFWYCNYYDSKADEIKCAGRLCCIQCGTELHRENVMTATLEPTKPLDPWEDCENLSFARTAEIAGVVEYVCSDCFLSADKGGTT